MRRKPKSKVCATCEVRKPINQPDHDDDAFGFQHNTEDGYRPHCRVCAGEMRRNGNKAKKRRQVKKAVETANKALGKEVVEPPPSGDLAELACHVVAHVPAGARVVIETDLGRVIIEPEKGATE